MKRTTFKSLSALILVLVLSLTLGLPGCVTTGGGTGQTSQEKYAAVVKQLPGVIEALADLALTAPVDEQTKAQLTEYASLAKTAAAAVAQLNTSDADTLARLQAIVQAMSTTVQSSTMDTQTKNQVANYVAWAGMALRAAALVGALI